MDDIIKKFLYAFIIFIFAFFVFYFYKMNFSVIEVDKKQLVKVKEDSNFVEVNDPIIVDLDGKSRYSLINDDIEKWKELLFEAPNKEYFIKK